MTTQIQKLLKKEYDELAVFSSSRLIVQQVDREIVIRLMRILEIQLNAEATTPLPSRHHT